MAPDIDSKDLKIIEHILSKNGLDVGSGVKRYTNGITNRVYAAGDKYVIKIEGDFEHTKKIFAHQKEIIDKLISIGVKTPKIMDSGEIDGKAYLLMEKLRGTNIVYDWLKFNMKQKENFISQLAEQLKKIHSITFDAYSIPISSGQNFSNLKDAIKRVVNFTHIEKDGLEKEDASNIDFLEEFYEKNLPMLDEEHTAVMVHNDVHLENIFYEGDEITGIIDFDWTSQAPKDYELRMITGVFREPKYAVEKRLEPLYENYKMTEEFGFLKKYYPELFKVNKLANRIRLYYLEKTIRMVTDYQKGKSDEEAMRKFRKETQELYKSDWLDDLVFI